MKKETLIKANEAVANATPETKKALGLRKHKEHTNYTSAFAIGEHAELNLLCFDTTQQTAFGRIEGVDFGVNGIAYTVAIAVNAGTEEKPEYEFHSGRPFIGVDERILSPYSSTLANDIANKYPKLDNCAFQIGDTVCLNLSEMIKDHSGAIPVLIWGVSYTKGKIMYDVSIDADEYKNSTAYNEIFERYLKHSIDRVDGIFIQPVGGWELENESSSTPNRSNEKH